MTKLPKKDNDLKLVYPFNHFLKSISGSVLLLSRRRAPCGRYREALVAPVVKPEHVATEHVADVLHAADPGAVRLHRPVRHVKRRVHHRQVVFFCRVLVKYISNVPIAWNKIGGGVKLLPSIFL